MNVKTILPTQKITRAGSALMLTMVMAGVALVTVAGVLAYTGSNARLNYRLDQYTAQWLRPKLGPRRS
jgi:hypothetical protein